MSTDPPHAVCISLYHLFYYMSLVPNIKYKTEYCHSWQTSTLCEKGSACFFAHGQSQLRTIQQNQQDILARYAAVEAKPNNYKTVFCKFYADGNCKLGDHCTFAHERREKRKKRPSQEYSQQEYIAPTWENPQMYQYYGTIYPYQYLQANYYYQQQQEYPIHEVKAEQGTSLELETALTSPNSPNNIKAELTLNHSAQTNQNSQQTNVLSVERVDVNVEQK